MRRHFWIVPLISAVALSAYLLGKPATAPADPNPQYGMRSPISPAVPGDPANAKVPQYTIGTSGPASQPLTPPAVIAPTDKAPQLPITQIILYSSGVGYVQRDGQVEGDARVDLAFPVQDVNDLLKSMVLQDLGGGHISAVNFDSQDPLDKTLNSFAIQLTNNPTYTQILGQARGEQVEISVQSANNTLQGKIVGVETKAPAAKDGSPVEVLNLWCADGMRSVAVADVQRIKFLNPAVESEVQRALEVLSSGHDTQKKSVTLHFSGTGKRAVRVGYVVETPLWRTSYRLLVGKDGKLVVQGWAIVQNPTNEDWKDVRMGLVSGRPISFKMDLYQPVYSTRPVVQPMVQAAVGPTSHGSYVAMPAMNVNTPGVPCNGVPSCYTGCTGLPTNSCGAVVNQNVQFAPVMAQPQMQWAVPQGCLQGPPSNGIGQNGFVFTSNGVVANTSATDLGDSFQYAIEHPVNVPRQKSALLPIVNKAMHSEKVSLYNSQTHAKYPLLALRLKNTTGVHLMQGPVAVYEGNGYAGDAQLPDLRPGEERLVSYALDLGTEVESLPAPAANRLASLRLRKGVLYTTTTQREAVTYVVKNRSPNDRVVLVEHVQRPAYKLISEQQPRERAQGVYRFEVKVAAGKTAKLEVLEEQDVEQQTPLLNCDVATTRYYLECDVTNAKVKPALEKLLQMQEKLTATRLELSKLQNQQANLTRELDQLRTALKETATKADAYKRYLAKFDAQDAVLEKVEKQLEVLKVLDQQQCRDCALYVNGLDVETKIRKAPDQAPTTVYPVVPPPTTPVVTPPSQAYPPNVPAAPVYTPGSYVGPSSPRS